MSRLSGYGPLITLGVIIVATMLTCIVLLVL